MTTGTTAAGTETTTIDEKKTSGGGGSALWGMPDIYPKHQRPRTVSLGELLRTTIPQREHLIFPWLRQRESAMVFAAPGVGKSFFALSLAMAVAGGGKALGKWEAPRARRVLYVDGEMPMDDLQDRVRSLMPSVGGDAEKLEKNFHFEARQKQPGGVIFTDLSDPLSRETLIYRATEARAELIILDNLSTLATLKDENSASEFTDIIKFILRLKQEGIACLLVHHSNKGGETYRGSSNLVAPFEVVIGLVGMDLKATDRPGVTRFRLSWPKYRAEKDADTGRTLDFAFEQGVPSFQDEGGGKGCIQWTCSLAEDTKIEQLLEYVRSEEGWSQRSLATVFEVSGATINKWKAKAIKQGLITEKEWREAKKGGKDSDNEREGANDGQPSEDTDY